MVEREVGQPSQANHESSDQRFEQELLESKLVSSRQVNFREVINREGIDKNDPFHPYYLYLDISEIPVNLQVRDAGDSLVYIGSFPADQVSFGGERLVRLLGNAKPIPKNGDWISQSIGGVVGDWGIMQERGKNEHAKGLYQDHISHGSIIVKHFEEFERNHFAVFWDAINLPRDYSITPVVVWKKDKTTGKKEYFCGRIWDPLIQAFPEMFSSRHDTLLGQIVVAGYSDELSRILPTKLPLVKGGPKQDMLEAQMPVFVSLFSRAYLNMSPVISGFEDLGREKVRI